MKYAKAAAFIAGTVLALGSAAPALADDGMPCGETVPACPGQASTGAWTKGKAASDKDDLINSNTVSKNVVKKPGDVLDLDVLVGGASRVLDKAKATNDTNASTKVNQKADVR
ncbi:hypothetical protein ABT160_40160 [Streptomyces sp. NPDC001941]|uniref:hypothetical protein n=1 Tax=Streptomyces sp. NPDC001941 TaxID=3154659 RepID=UPI003330E5E7